MGHGRKGRSRTRRPVEEIAEGPFGIDIGTDRLLARFTTFSHPLSIAHSALRIEDHPATQHPLTTNEPAC